MGAQPSLSVSLCQDGRAAPSGPGPAEVWREAGSAWHKQHWRQEPCTDLRMARETFCFQGLSLRMPIPKPERKKSSPVVTRSHFWEASNSSTAESQMKAWSLLDTQEDARVRLGSPAGLQPLWEQPGCSQPEPKH